MLKLCAGVSCGDPGQPSHGSRIIIDGVQRTYVYEDKVKLSCNQYYSILEGDTIRTCRADGSWSGSQLKCTPSECTLWLHMLVHGGYMHANLRTCSGMNKKYYYYVVLNQISLVRKVSCKHWKKTLPQRCLDHHGCLDRRHDFK